MARDLCSVLSATFVLAGCGGAPVSDADPWVEASAWLAAEPRTIHVVVEMEPPPAHSPGAAPPDRNRFAEAGGAMTGGVVGAAGGAVVGAGAGALLGAGACLATGPIAPLVCLVTIPFGAVTGGVVGAVGGGVGGVSTVHKHQTAAMEKTPAPLAVDLPPDVVTRMADLLIRAPAGRHALEPPPSGERTAAHAALNVYVALLAEEQGRRLRARALFFGPPGAYFEKDFSRSVGPTQEDLRTAAEALAAEIREYLARGAR